MKLQPQSSKKGEIEFRRNLVKRQVEGDLILEDEHEAASIERILQERMAKTRKRMSALKGEGVVISPYLEIGAERCQRALVMENDLDSPGAALDISFEMLKSCDYYSGVFKRSVKPKRICGDAYFLPFLSNSVPFVFCYETLHHFPDPEPVVREIHRVLSPGGYFYFDEEPYKKTLHLDLYERKAQAAMPEKSVKPIVKVVRHLFSKPVFKETEYGIIENHGISIRTWKNSLSSFESAKVRLHSMFGLCVEMEESRPSLSYMLAYLNGGTIEGICRKSGQQADLAADIEDVLACPLCLQEGFEKRLLRKESELECTGCGRCYPICEEVLVLLPTADRESYYPQLNTKLS